MDEARVHTDRCKNLYKYETMVQTHSGARENPWLTYMRACAERYRAGEQLEALESPPKHTPCNCDTQPIPKPKRGKSASKAQSKQEVDKAIKTEKSKARKITKQSEKGLQQTGRNHNNMTRKGEQPEGGTSGTLDQYAHATARALQRVQRERAEARK